MKRDGFLVVVSGPSGVGKNALIRHVLPRMSDVRYSVSVTTRPLRRGEKDGEDYFFVSESEFCSMVAEDKFLEWAEFSGYRYGTPRLFIEEALQKGEIVITEIDIQGARQIKEKMPEGVFVFLLPPSWHELQKRLNKRATEDDIAIKKRLELAKEEIKALANYEYVIINDDLNRASSDLETVIKAEKLRTKRINNKDKAYYLV